MSDDSPIGPIQFRDGQTRRAFVSPWDLVKSGQAGPLTIGWLAALLKALTPEQRAICARVLAEAETQKSSDPTR